MNNNSQNENKIKHIKASSFDPTAAPEDAGSTKIINTKQNDPGHVKKSTNKTDKTKKGRNSKKNSSQPVPVTISINVLQSVFYIGFIVAISCFLALTFVNIANDVFALKKDTTIEYTITLNEDSTLKSISRELEENGIINYGSVFEIYGKIKNDNGKFLTGDIALNAGMDYDTIRTQLKYAKVENKDVRLVIPEGYTVDQIIDLLVSNGIGNRDRYVEVINNYDFEFDFIPAIESLSPERTYRLEGYLFPDTYDFNSNEKEETVIYKFLSNFQRKFEKEYYRRAEELGLTVDDVIILASMIEREVRIATDYEIVSSVFHNRLNSSTLTKLESDATINYFLEEHTKDLTAEHLMIDNPYNTYMYEGLPPGAICNPGVEAIAYAFYPITTKYYFFVSQDDGTTLYAATKAEHEANKLIAKQANEQMKNQGN